MKKRNLIGLRTVKTAVAVILSMMLASLLGTSDARLIFAMLGAMNAVQPTFKESVQASLTQIVGVIFGVGVSLLLLLLPVHQLVVAGVGIVKQAAGSDPASVVFDAINSAKSKNADVLIVDTAGRLHNKKNLMDELAKIDRVISRELSGCSKETLLVLDATTGQNAVMQAKEFKGASNITGLILTKLDGTAKGGIVLSVKKELGIPVKFIGVGEKIDDMKPFDRDEFTRALFERN